MATVACVSQQTDLALRQRNWKALVVLPVALLGFLFVHFALLPAHGLAGHFEMMPGAATAGASVATHSHHGAAGAEQASAHVTATQHESVAAQASTGGHDHGAGGVPSCHADPNFVCVASGRTLADELGDLSQWLAVLVMAVVLGTVVTLPRVLPRSRWRWSTTPPWRLSGVAFLSFAGVSLT